jgi:hypothetical protein
MMDTMTATTTPEAPEAEPSALDTEAALTDALDTTVARLAATIKAAKAIGKIRDPLTRAVAANTLMLDTEAALAATLVTRSLAFAAANEHGASYVALAEATGLGKTTVADAVVARGNYATVNARHAPRRRRR